MTGRSRKVRVLMYSHDTFGLGHLRRCRTIAHSLVQDYHGLQVLIISGSTIAGAFDYRARVDFVKIPSVIKLRNSEYTSMDKHIDVSETIEMRKSMIFHTAKTFEPDILIIDKEPLGLRGEVEDTLRFLRARGTTLVLGLREVMDAPHLLDVEWKRNDTMHKIGELYHHIWVYGPPDFHDPLVGLDVPESVRSKMEFVGFLQRKSSKTIPADASDYLLVTTGGGGDGSDLVRDVIAAYQADPTLTMKAVIVLGPYMPNEQRMNFVQQAADNPHIEIIEFDSRMEDRIAGARAVVAMGGYNTYCEILSFDKPALIVPRMQPRLEQFIRARRAAELGLISMLPPEEAADGLRMAAAIKALLKRDPPSASPAAMHLEGLPTISSLVAQYLSDRAELSPNIAQG
ncbi:hypothetical protein HGO38_18450 [Rhizobium sp. CG5]|uniref:glycosyltransferase family protein n=1 Tax=Rhizobium sp. CG5 TaxID=2726076 RepID=UPI002033F049|nr:glycosyltransferase family protein [Rhizobium sp. CG5]MCM2475466.1 hypothetical protein [Rhizobium sp. CG5]